MESVWNAMIIVGVVAMVAMVVAMVMWKLLPNSNLASFNGKHWKFGGAFAGFVFVWVYGITLIWNNVEQLKELENTGIVAEVIDPPNERQRYKKLFSDLDENSPFIAFNAPFVVEERGSKVFWDDAMKVHVSRYKSGVNSRYLFFDSGSYERATAFFTKLKEEMKKEKMGDEIFNQQIEIAELVDEMPVPCNSFFLTIQNKKKVVIFYPEPYKSDGVPDRVIVLVGANKLYDKYWKVFDGMFAKARKLSDEDFRRRDPKFKGY